MPAMKRRLLALAVSALVWQQAWAAEPAELSLYLFDEGRPVADAEVQIDAATRGRTSSDGALNLRIEPGARRLRVLRGGAEVLSLELNLVEDEDAQIIATLYPDAAPSVFIESTNAGAAAAAEAKPELGPPGTLSGRVVNIEDGKPLAGARVFVSGTPIDLVTDAEGRYSAEIPPGSYAVSVLAPRFASRSFEGVAIVSEQTTEQAIELTPAGVELPEFVVLEPFIEGSLASFVEERRTSSAVTDILGAEQISRAGDSDAAGALKRVTGLTLVDGKFVYVRGLGERYSSTLLNGAQVPSPDPTRRVVPLDLFPTEVLQGIVVQKTYTADMPGEFAGGTIQLRTRGVPEEFFFRSSLSLGFADGTTGEEGIRYQGSSRDWTGRDDGTRFVDSVFGTERLPQNLGDLEAAGRDLLQGSLATRRDSLGPNGGFGLGLGDDFRFGDSDVSLGYIASVRYANAWDAREEKRLSYSQFQGNLLPAEDFVRERTDRAVDASLFGVLGLRVGELHKVDLTLTRLRQSTDQTQIDDGVLGSGNIDIQTSLEWIENSLDTAQLAGEHSLPKLGGLLLTWQATDAGARRYAPNSRLYRFTLDEGSGAYENNFNVFRIEDLQDESSDYAFNLKKLFKLGERAELSVQAGASRFERERDSRTRRFRFTDRVNGNQFSGIDDRFNPGRVGPNGLRLEENTQASDFYTAEQQLDARYLMLDAGWGELRMNLGVRREEMLQTVTTVLPFNPNAIPVIGLLDNVDDLPSGSLTWSYSDKAQVRLGYSTTLSRPDIREQSPANFVDPLLDVRVQGNPDLVQAEIENIDLRWEYYFSTLESFSVALFSKEFTNPIELISTPASGELLAIDNADSATNVGIEFDIYKSLDGVGRLGVLPDFLKRLPWQDVYFGANYARIDSEIDLGDPGIQTNTLRPLQGQSKYVANASLSYLHPEGRTEAQLSWNVFGERISRVGVNGLPDVYEQPFNQVDFTLSQKLPWDGFAVKLRLRNLLDPEVRFEQGGSPTRAYRKGREAALSVEWKF
jgi:hypothetical protein